MEGGGAVNSLVGLLAKVSGSTSSLIRPPFTQPRSMLRKGCVALVCKVQQLAISPQPRSSRTQARPEINPDPMQATSNLRLDSEVPHRELPGSLLLLLQNSVAVLLAQSTSDGACLLGSEVEG